MASEGIEVHSLVLLSNTSTKASGLQQPNTANCQPPSATVSIHSANRAQHAAHFSLLSHPPTTKSKDPIAVQLWPSRAVASGGIDVHSLVQLSYISTEDSAIPLHQPNIANCQPPSATVSMHSAKRAARDSLVIVVLPSDHEEQRSDCSAAVVTTGCGQRSKRGPLICADIIHFYRCQYPAATKHSQLSATVSVHSANKA